MNMTMMKVHGLQKIVAWGVVASLMMGWSGLAAAQPEVNSASSQPAENTYQPVLDRLTQLTPTMDSSLQLEAEKINYPLGAALELRFVVEQEGYVLLMRIAPDGTITFPIPELPVLSGQVYSTAGTAGTASPDNVAQYLGLDLKAGTNIGTDVFNLVYSPEKLDWFSGDFAHDPAYTITSADETRLQRLLTELEHLSQTTWSGTSASLTIGPLLKSAVPRKHGAIPPIRATGTTGKESTRGDERNDKRTLWNVSSDK